MFHKNVRVRSFHLRQQSKDSTQEAAIHSSWNYPTWKKYTAIFWMLRSVALYSQANQLFYPKVITDHGSMFFFYENQILV